MNHKSFVSCVLYSLLGCVAFFVCFGFFLGWVLGVFFAFFLYIYILHLMEAPGMAEKGAKEGVHTPSSLSLS